MNTQDQTHPTKHIADQVHHISEAMMVELQQTTFGVMLEIFWMETLFTAYENEVDLNPLMAFKSMSDTSTIYLQKYMK